MTTCSTCRGSHVCMTCGGRGTMGGGMTNPVKCPTCNGNKGCTVCKGRSTG